VVVYSWQIPPGWETEHHLHISIAILENGGRLQVTTEQLSIWPFTHADIRDDLAAAGLTIRSGRLRWHDPIAPGSPRWGTTQSRTSPNTASASQAAADSSRCIPRGQTSPACSARLQQFVCGNPAIIPRTKRRNRSRGSNLLIRAATQPRRSSRPASHRPGSTL
jgi:hypothetical protein